MNDKNNQHTVLYQDNRLYTRRSHRSKSPHLTIGPNAAPGVPGTLEHADEGRSMAWRMAEQNKTR